MWEILEREGIYLWFYFSIQLKQIFLYWVIGIMAGSVISVFAKAKIHAALSRIDDRKWGLFGIFPASLLGILSPLCMYGTIPIAASFAAKGVREDWLASFMMSSMLLNPQLILYSAALGRTMLTIRIVTCLLCGVSAGLLLHFCFRKKKFFRFEGMQEPENHDTDPCMPVRLLKNIWRNIKVTGPYFLVGIVLSALFQRYVPAESFASLFGEGNKGFGLLMAATLGVPMYVCGGGTIPLLMTWLNQGMSYGAATSFMLTGPATKITNLGAVKIVLGMRHFLYYLLFVMLYALLCGGVAELIVNEN